MNKGDIFYKTVAGKKVEYEVILIIGNTVISRKT